MNYVDNKIHSRKLSAIYNICRRHINVSRKCFLLRCYLMSKSFYTTMTIAYLISSENDTEILESKTIYYIGLDVECWAILELIDENNYTLFPSINKNFKRRWKNPCIWFSIEIPFFIQSTQTNYNYTHKST